MSTQIEGLWCPFLSMTFLKEGRMAERSYIGFCILLMPISPLKSEPVAFMAVVFRWGCQVFW